MAYKKQYRGKAPDMSGMIHRSHLVIGTGSWCYIEEMIKNVRNNNKTNNIIYSLVAA